jgi:hypothetical protein
MTHENRNDVVNGLTYSTRLLISVSNATPNHSNLPLFLNVIKIACSCNMFRPYKAIFRQLFTN